MITTSKEYFANLHILQNVDAPTYALLPSSEKTYNIDLNSRTVEAPKFLGLEKDQSSQTIYFKVDRYADYMDLAQTCCVIQCNNAHNETKYYPVPFYDIYKFAGEKKIVFPWCLDINITEFAGPIQFSIRFFKVGSVLNQLNESVPVLTYNLNTLPAKSTILAGIKEYEPVDPEKDTYFLKPGEADRIWAEIDQIKSAQIEPMHWTILDDSFIPTVNTDSVQKQLQEVLDNANKL